MSRAFRLHLVGTGVVLWGFAAIMAWLREPVRAAEVSVTWRGQIAPLVYRNCTTCHHTGGSGPFDLTTFAAARRWGPQMAEVTASRFMPPWLPEEGHVKLQGDRHLRAADIELIAGWVKGGMPEGSGPQPKPPVYDTGWEMGPPDLVLTMPEAVTVPASGTDLFENFILPATVRKTRWVRAMEIRPLAGSSEGDSGGKPEDHSGASSAAATHHANVVLDRTASLRAAHGAEWRKGFPGMGLEVDAGDAFDPDSHFLFWKPDSTALVEPEGMPWRLDPGNDLILNMHLKPTGKPEQVRASIGLYFTDKPATAHPMLVQLEHDAALNIPAGAKNFVVSDELTLPLAVDLLGMYPHAHYLCREMEVWAVLPGGGRETLLRIRDWDINRQSVYRLATPLRLPRGTVVHMRYTYDNSAANPHNPNSPPIAVAGGDRAVDEMGHLWLQLLPVAGAAPSKEVAEPRLVADPRLALERAWMEARLRKVPSDRVAQYNLAALTLAEGDAPGAVARFSALLQLDPADARVAVSLGSAKKSAGDSAGAEEAFEGVLRRDPGNIDAAFDLAASKLRGGENAEAERLFGVVLEKNPADAKARIGLGEALLQQAKNAEAIPQLKRVLDAEPQEPAVRRLLAMAYSAAGEGQQALTELRAWARLAPGEPEPHRALAQVLHGAGRDSEALAEQHEVVRLAPGNANDWNDLGAMEAAAGRTAEARADLEHALRLDPANQAARKNLGRL